METVDVTRTLAPIPGTPRGVWLVPASPDSNRDPSIRRGIRLPHHRRPRPGPSTDLRHSHAELLWQALSQGWSLATFSRALADYAARRQTRDRGGLVAAGKHVLCEKPLSDTLEDARSMADVARNANTVVCIGFTFRRAAGAAALRGLVNSGALGRILRPSNSPVSPALAGHRAFKFMQPCSIMGCKALNAVCETAEAST
jgi:Oxidoreductase family, NAD-binding Rossmann fold